MKLVKIYVRRFYLTFLEVCAGQRGVQVSHLSVDPSVVDPAIILVCLLLAL